MAQLLYGAPVADEVCAQALELIRPLGLRPLLAVVRAGADPDDRAYEKSIRAACAKCGVDVWTAELPAFAPQDALVRAVHRIGRDEAIHGVIVMCPRQYDLGLIAAAVGRDKDVDGAGFAEGGVFVPCTAEAVAALLDYYGVECAGKKVTVVGRGAVTGAPAAALLADRGADVSVCHSRTENPAELCRRADIITPNITEASLLTKLPYSAGPHDEAYIAALAEGLSRLCGGVIAITGVRPEAGSIGVYTVNVETGESCLCVRPAQEGVFCGTGDLFASAFAALTLRGAPLRDAAETATTLVAESIARTVARGTPRRNGVDFENALPNYIRQVERLFA